MPVVQVPALSPVESPTITASNARQAVVLPLLDARGWSPGTLAIEAELDVDTVADYLSNTTKPYRSTLVKLARALGVPVQQLPR